MNTWGQANSAYNLAMALQETGDYEEALAMARQAVATARCLDFSPLLLLSLAALGTAHRALFQLEEACAAHLEALQIAERLGPRFYTQLSAAELCADWAVRGDWAQALAYVGQALAARDYSIGYVGLWRWYETEALVRGGALAHAEEDTRRFGER